LVVCNKEKFTDWYKFSINFNLFMAKLQCRDYGFDCDFVVDGEVESVIAQFGKHTDDVHGIEYSKEALMQIILRKS